MAQQAKSAPAVVVTKIAYNGAVAAKLRPNTARSRFAALASECNGKPVAELESAFTKAGTGLHGEKSVHFKRGQQERFSGWLAWAVRTGLVTVK